MRTSPIERLSRAEHVRVTRDSIIVGLIDGRTLKVPLSWYPRLRHGTVKERENWRLIGGGAGIHWPDLDEDISIDGLLAGLPSQESSSSFAKWSATRLKTRPDKRRQRTAQKTRRG